MAPVPEHLRAHVCTFPYPVPAGVLWRCECGQLWQLSIAMNGWITVSDEDAGLLRAIGFELP